MGFFNKKRRVINDMLYLFIFKLFERCVIFFFLNGLFVVAGFYVFLQDKEKEKGDGMML
mgnify:CR=1 FL=1